MVHLRLRFWSLGIVTGVLVLTLCMMLFGHAEVVHPILTLQSPSYLVPGQHCEVTYRLALKSSKPVNATLAFFPLNADAKAQNQPLISFPVQLQCGKSKSISLDLKALPIVTASYLIRLTAGSNDQYIAECRSQVKAWDLIGCFVDPVTEQEKRDMDSVGNEYAGDPEIEYGGPPIDDEAEVEPEHYPYCSGINPKTVTSKQINIKTWFSGQSERQASHLYITNSGPTYKISPQEWEQVWGIEQAKKKWYDDQGAVLYPLNGIFYTTAPGQYHNIKMVLAKDCATDYAGNTVGVTQTIIEKVTIDGEGKFKSKWFYAVPHKDKSAYKVKPDPPKPRKLTRFERFYPIYRAHIAEIAAKYAQQRARSSQPMIQDKQEREQRVVDSEKDLLEQLRKRAHKYGRKKLFEMDGEALEREIILPHCEASGRIFTQLYKENLVGTKELLESLGYYHDLSQIWITLVQDIVRNSEPHSEDWRRGINILYKAGVNREIYRSDLEKDALAGNSATLYILFFTFDNKTGIPQVCITDANDKLLERLCDEKSKPGIRTVCTAYAAASGKIALAERIGSEVCAVAYIGAKRSDDGYAESPRQDSELFGARCRTGYSPNMLAVLFYEVRTEKAFRIILERSDAARAIKFGYRPVPLPWHKTQGYSLAEWELEQADSLINTLKEFDKQVAKK